MFIEVFKPICTQPSIPEEIYFDGYLNINDIHKIEGYIEDINNVDFHRVYTGNHEVLYAKHSDLIDRGVIQ